MRRKRPVGRTIYTIDYLLSKQPKGIQKSPFYSQMMLSLTEGGSLSHIRFNRRCYSLLHNGVIKPEHLDNFHRTYRLPRHPFFPLFFLIKRQYLDQREATKADRKRYISEKIDRSSPPLRWMMKTLQDLEAHSHPTSKSPLYYSRIYPKTKGGVNKLTAMDHMELSFVFEKYLSLLSERYRVPEREGQTLTASLILNCTPTLYGQPKREKVLKSFRKLSKIHHPDQGGNPQLFIRLKWAKKILIHP